MSPWSRRISTAWHHLLSWLRRFGRREIVLLIIVLAIVWGSNQFIDLADDVTEGDTQDFDEWVVRSLRRADDPAVPIGPLWLREAAIDLTALGSHVVLVIVVATVAGFLALQRKYRTMSFVLIGAVGGMILSTVLKQIIDRGRPEVVPHLREVMTPSFPSGHAMLSAVIFLTLGTLLTRVVKDRWTKLYCILVALALSLLVGASRVYLGVHYPTDVLAGWTAGLIWALICWAVVQFFQLDDESPLRRLPWRRSRSTQGQDRGKSIVGRGA